MTIMFLLVRLLFGGYVAWRGAEWLSPYGRTTLVPSTGSRGFVLAMLGLAAVGGGACIITGIAVPAGVAMIVAYAAGSASGASGGLRLTHISVAAVALLFLAVPRPWPLAFVD